MKLLSLLCLCLSFSAFAAGKFSDENYVICDVEISKWPEVKRHGLLEIAPGSKDPFIHCARPSQLHFVMNKYFNGTTQMIMVVHASKVAAIIEYEDNYPHLYGSLDLKLVDYFMVISPKKDGSYSLPAFFKK